MEPIDRAANPEFDGIRRVVPRQRGLAMFGILILVVTFTLLGVGALSLANRENQNTGSILDIKSRQSAAYAGLVFALGEFQRDPANFVALLESWRKKTVYGALTNPLPKLYLQFNATTAVAFTKTQPAAFAIPNTPYKIVVELAGIQVPSSATQEPVIVLRSTGTGRSGDQQTIVGTYRVRNVKYSVATANLGITHPFYLNGKGMWNNKILAKGGDVFFGNDIHLNSTSEEVSIQNGGLRVNGNVSWDNVKAFDVQGNSWITGNLGVQSSPIGPTMQFQSNLVVSGNIVYATGSKVDVNGSVVVQGATGIELHSGKLWVGTAGLGSELQVPNGMARDGTGGGLLDVAGSAYLKQVGDGTQVWTLNASTKLELSDNPGVVQKFRGNGTWGKLVARNAAALSRLNPAVAGSITIQGDSWLEDPASMSLGGTSFTWGAGVNLYAADVCGGCTGIVPLVSAPPAAANISTIAHLGAGVNGADRFDAIFRPKTLTDLGYSATTPATEKEIGFDLTKDATIQTRAWPATGSALCSDATKICGKALNAAYADAANASCFYNGFFVVLLNGVTEFTWDAGTGNSSTASLVGKFLFIVTGDVASSDPWPTTATNPDPTNPANVQFIYVTKTGNIFAHFNPRITNSATAVVPFFGYVRVEDPGTMTRSWDFAAPITLEGAFHVVGDPTKVNMTVNSSPTGQTTFNLNQGTLSVIGAAFGTVFTDPVAGTPLVNPALAGFQATENWIQFQAMSELR